MALFGNDNKKTIEELENYYSNKSQRTGMAWAMAFLSLLITVAVLGALFFGGRWLYRTFTDDPVSPVATNNNSETEEENASSVLGNLGLTLNDSQTDGVVDDGAARTDEPNTDRIASSDDAQNQDGADNQNDTTDQSAAENEENSAVAGVSDDQNSEIPDTGAGSILIATPLIVFFISYIVARTRYAEAENN